MLKKSAPSVDDLNHCIVAGSGIYVLCPDCEKLVKVNKWLFGSLHICAGEESGG